MSKSGSVVRLYGRFGVIWFGEAIVNEWEWQGDSGEIYLFEVYELDSILLPKSPEHTN